jgi:hypothetical protein
MASFTLFTFAQDPCGVKNSFRPLNIRPTDPEQTTLPGAFMRGFIDRQMTPSQ